MPLPPDNIFVPETPDSPEDPFGLFPSETALRVPRTRAIYTRGRQFAVLMIELFLRWFAIVVTATRRLARFAAASGASAASSLRGVRLPMWRLPAWRVPALRLPSWRLPDWRLSNWHLRVWHLPAWQLPRWQNSAWRDAAWSTIVSAFALGIFVGGSAVWLLGASRQAAVEPARSQQTPGEVPRAAGSPVPPVATAFTDRPVVRAPESKTSAVTLPPANRRPQFRGSLIVNSRPSGARVFVNGRSVGETPLVLRNQPAGSRAIRVALEGYEPWSSAVQVVADTETRLRAELKARRTAAQ